MKQELYTLDGRPSLWQVLPFSIQQLLAMFVNNLVPIGLLAAAASPELSQGEILRLTQGAMMAAGIATFIQATPIWKFGSGLPIFMGVSFTFIVPLTAVAAKYGYGAVVGTVLVGGVFEGLLGFTVRWWRRVVAPIVSALVVTGIGLSLLSVAARSFGGGYVQDFGSLPNLVIGFVTLASSILWTVLTKGVVRQISILVGLAVGYLTAVCFGRVDFSGIGAGGLFSLPQLLPYKPVFRLDAIISVCIIYLVSATETIGDLSAITNGALHRSPTQNEITGVLTTDGFGSVISGFFGVSPITSYSQNVGLTIMTGVVNRNVARVGGVLLVLCGLLPPAAGLMNTIPEPVIGGMLLIVLGQILVSGFEMIAKVGFTPRTKLITAITLSVAVGFTASTEAGIWESFPVAIQSIFSQNVVAVIFVLALVLNLVLPKNIEE